MGQAGKYLRTFGIGFGERAGYNSGAGFMRYCPGCELMHGFAVSESFKNGARWTFNGDLDKPTFSPSMNIGDNWCHYYLTAGMLIFSGGNKGHGLSGQTVPLPELPPEYRDA